MAEKAEGKVLWVLPDNAVNRIVGVLIVTTVVAIVWALIMGLDFSRENEWVFILEVLLLAAVVGYASGMIIGTDQQSKLWIAAGFAIVGLAMTRALVEAGLFKEGGAGFDAALLSSLEAGAFAPEVSVGAIVLAIIAAAFAVVGSKSKM